MCRCDYGNCPENCGCRCHLPKASGITPEQLDKVAEMLRELERYKATLVEISKRLEPIEGSGYMGIPALIKATLEGKWDQVLRKEIP